MRTTLHPVLPSKQASKLRSIIIRGQSRALRCTVTKFHTNWPHQLRYPETDLYRVGCDYAPSGGRPALLKLPPFDTEGTQASIQTDAECKLLRFK